MEIYMNYLQLTTTMDSVRRSLEYLQCKY